ncbi:MAG TPA: hypothetical protein V6D08_20570 [Candidatus Obscuribacterales bacterium]
MAQTPESKAKQYIVYREIADNGPMGSVYGYVKTTAPNPGERIFHGTFLPRTMNCGQYDAETMTVYDPVGEVTSEVFGGEQF